MQTTGDETVVDQINKQLNKLVDVVKLVDLSEGEHIEREMMLIKVRAEKGMRDEMKRLSEIFRGKIIDVTENSFVIEMTGDSAKLDAFINAISDDYIVEVVRTGVSGIARGNKALTL